MYRLTKRRKRDFALLMDEIDTFCKSHQIYQGRGSDSYYFSIRGKPYVIANRKKEVPEGTTFLLASKTRIMKIYEDLLEGKDLDYRGSEKSAGNYEVLGIKQYVRRPKLI